MLNSENAEIEKMLDEVSRRMNKAADKMIVAAGLVNNSKDENVRKTWLKTYQKHRMKYLWYKNLLEENLKSIDLETEKIINENKEVKNA